MRTYGSDVHLAEASWPSNGNLCMRTLSDVCFTEMLLGNGGDGATVPFAGVPSVVCWMCLDCCTALPRSQRMEREALHLTAKKLVGWKLEELPAVVSVDAMGEKRWHDRGSKSRMSRTSVERCEAGKKRVECCLVPRQPS